MPARIASYAFAGGRGEIQMSTSVFEMELYTDIWEKKDLPYQLQKAKEEVQKQIDGGCDIIEIHICGLEISLNYETKELMIIS